MQSMNMHIVNSQSSLTPQQLQRYFAEFPKVVKLFLIGFILVVVAALCGAMNGGTTSSGNFFIVAFFSIPLDIAIARIAIYYWNRPTDAEYDAWVNSWRLSIREDGLQSLGMTDADISGEELYVRGIVWPDTQEAEWYNTLSLPIALKKGMDGRPRGSINRFTFFFPTDHYIAVFAGDLNALSDLKYEGTKTYYYDDIVGVETNALVLPLGKTKVGMQEFSLQVSGGQAIGTSMIDMNGDIVGTISSLRKLLRDKKFGIQGGGRPQAGYQ